MDSRRPYVCSDFLERVHSDVCHLCNQPESAHPTDDDAPYWAAWLVSEIELMDWDAEINDVFTVHHHSIV